MGETSAASNERYSVLDRLGQGGMGVVYRATDRKDGRILALKRLLSTAQSKSAARDIELFHQEFRTLAQLAHPHVVRVDDFGVDDHGPYYTMELLAGDDLHTLSPLPFQTACSLVRDVCSALALLHSRRLLHRDLSPRNIKCTVQGRAKLIDFGAMAPMGVQRLMIGTPPFIPPEAISRQPLDARADLYALGATLYYVLTGTHAYPAKRLQDLQAMWRLPPPAPSARVAGIPPELDALVLSLLSIDPMSRPRSAAEVLDRLNTIADLPSDEQLAVRHSYLSTPALVGREQETAQIRQRLLKLHAGRGGVLVIEGEAGVGRSRVLDVLVMEGKLAGLSVVRASAADAGSYGALSALVTRLFEIMPSLPRGNRASAEILELLLHGAIDGEVDNARRGELYEAIRGLVRVGSRRQPLVLAVDDFDLCDELSQAALAYLIKACAREHVLLAITRSSSVVPDASTHGLLRDGADVLTLRPLQASEVELLLGSLFGDAPNLSRLAAYMNARVEGKARDCMDLAQLLVDEGLVRYQMGHWILPGVQAEAALPTSMTRARRGKLDALSDDARALAEALALAEGCELDSAASIELTAHGDITRMHASLDEMLVAKILHIDATRSAFSGQVWVDELRADAPVERERQHCARIADALARRGRDPLHVAHYRVRAGQTALAIDTVLGELAAKESRWNNGPKTYGDLLQHCVAAADALPRPRRERMLLLRELISVGQDLTVPNLRPHFLSLFTHLRRDSGLDDWDALDTGMPALERLQKALEITQQRFDASNDQERGLPPIEAIRVLTRLATECGAYAAQVSDCDLFDVLPSLEPLCPLSPAIARVWNLSIPACRATVAGRYTEALDLYKRSLEAVSTAETSGMDEISRQWSSRALHYAIGCIEANYGRKAALDHAAELEREPSWAITANSVRCIYYGNLGNQRETERARKQLELMLLQSPVKPVLSAGAAHQYVYIASISDDLTWLRQLVHEVEHVAMIHPSFRVFSTYARAEVARVCGAYDEAIRIQDEVLSMIRPGQSPLWAWSASNKLFSLVGANRFEEAYETGLHMLAIAESIQLDILRDHIEVPLALAEAKLGKYSNACARLDAAIARRQSTQMEGVVHGWVLEARARVALWMNNKAIFEHYAQLCGQQYKKSGGNPALAAKYERLLQEGRQHGLDLSATLESSLISPPTSATPLWTRTGASIIEREVDGVSQSMAACNGAQERAQQALALLCQRAGVEHGHLYLFNESGLTLSASSADDTPDDEVRSIVGRVVQTSCDESDDEVTQIGELERPEAPVTAQPRVWPVLLSCRSHGQTLIAGVAALCFPPHSPVRLPMEAATVIARVLVGSGDVCAREIRGGTTQHESA